MLVGGVVGWLVSAVGTAVSKRSADAVLGTTEERALRDALSDSVAAILNQVPEGARGDLGAALRERVTVPSLGEVSGDGPSEIFANVIDELIAPLALPGQTLANHHIDPEWLSQSLLDALIPAIRRAAVISGILADLAQLIGIERLEIAQQRLERLILAERDDRRHVINTLPRALRRFADRIEVLDRLRAVAGADPGVAVAVVVIQGMAGIGKTALAVHAAHLLAHDLPDARLFIDLHGFTSGIPPDPPENALASLLIALGVPPDRVPPTLDQRVALWRSRLSGKRAIIVLDNALNAAQVEPLIPGTPGCVVLVTSRHTMASLDGAELVTLGVLPEEAAAELLGDVPGESATSEPLISLRIARLCGCLPLAVRLAAGRIRQRPQLHLENLAEELADTRRRLTSLREGSRDIEAAFELSYQALEPAPRATFRRLGLNPGPDITVETAASLADVTSAEAERQLEELLTQSLVQEAAPGRFVLHDLIRDYADERAVTEDGEEECEASRQRLLTMLTGKAMDVDRELSQAAQNNEPAGAIWAKRWLESERTNIVAAARLAEQRTDLSAVRLARSLGDHLMNLGFMDDTEFVFQAAARVGDALGDIEAHALGLLGCGKVQRLTARYPAARENLTHAHALSAEIGDQAMAADALYHLGEIERATGDFAMAKSQYEKCQRICAATGDRRSEANALGGLGDVAVVLGDLGAAREYYRNANALSVAANDRGGQAFALLALGELERAAGDFATARVYYEAGRTLCLDSGDRRAQANAAYGLGEVASATLDSEAALRYFADAYAISSELGNRRGQAYALLGTGDTERATGENGAAMKHLTTAHAICQEIGDRPGQARALVGLGDIAEHDGEIAKAAVFWREARDLLNSAGLTQRAIEVSQRLSRRE